LAYEDSVKKDDFIESFITCVYICNRNAKGMEKMCALSEELETAGFNVTKSVRIDEEMEKRLGKIALYEKVSPGTMMRMMIEDKIRVYYRNPDFKRWLRQFSLIPLKSEKEKRKK